MDPQFAGVIAALVTIAVAVAVTIIAVWRWSQRKVFAEQAAAPDASSDGATRCRDCGRRSRWRDGFARVSGAERVRTLCPPCATRLVVSRARRQAWSALASLLAGLVWHWTDGFDTPIVLLIGWSIFYVSVVVGLFVHEWAHAFVGRLVECTPQAIVIGPHPWSFDVRVLGSRWLISAPSMGGAVYVAPMQAPGLPIRMLAVVWAGPLASGLHAALGFYGFAALPGQGMESIPRVAVLAIAVGQAGLAFSSLWPASVRTVVGIDAPSDGLQVWHYLSGRASQSRQLLAAGWYLKASLAYRDGDTATADECTRELEQLDLDLVEAKILRACIWCECDEPARTRDLLAALLARRAVDSAAAAGAARSAINVLRRRPQ
jgi:hypothetical protein